MTDSGGLCVMTGLDSLLPTQLANNLAISQRYTLAELTLLGTIRVMYVCVESKSFFYNCHNHNIILCAAPLLSCTVLLKGLDLFGWMMWSAAQVTHLCLIVPTLVLVPTTVATMKMWVWSV